MIMSTIGFIGLGIMGEAMCGRLIESGYQLLVHDRSGERMELVASPGARSVSSPEMIADECRLIMIMVPASKDVESVVNALLPRLAEGSLVIDLSTIDPAVSVALAGKVRERGSRMIDAPVVKSRAAAEAGELGILVGGDGESLERARPILACLGREILHMGPNGSGLAMKLCHNMLVAGIQYAVNEMMILAGKSGLDFDLVLRAIKAGGAQNLFLDSKAEFLRKRDFTARFPFEHMRKDLHLADMYARSLGLTLEGSGLCRKIFDRGMVDGYGRKDYAAAIEVMEKMAAGNND